MRVHLTLKSRNVKTGPIPVSTTTAASCPNACPFKAKGCYAQGGPLAIHWRKVTEGLGGMGWSEFCDAIEALQDDQLWRHNQAGDLPGEADEIDIVKLAKLVEANRGKRGFTYTHKPMTVENAAAVRAANDAGFTINLSGNNPAHADELLATGAGPVVTVLPQRVEDAPTHTPNGTRIVICPAVTRDDVSCATCGLCQRVNRKVVVGFPAHGSTAKAAARIAAS